jgi:hypothetical protein
MTGGDLYTNNISIGKRHGGRGGNGSFLQSGGTVHGEWIFLNYANGGDSSLYELSGDGQIIADTIWAYQPWGPAVFRQTGGTVTLSGYRGQIVVGHASGHWGLFDMQAGVFSAEAVYVGSEVPGMSLWDPGAGGKGTFRHVGGTVSVGLLRIGERGILESPLAGAGHQAIEVSGIATLGGIWQVLDQGAEIGRFDIITAEGGFSDSFDTINLPGAGWSWGIEDNRTLWVELVPEPATLSMLALGGLAIMRRRRRK